MTSSRPPPSHRLEPSQTCGGLLLKGQKASHSPPPRPKRMLLLLLQLLLSMVHIAPPFRRDPSCQSTWPDEHPACRSMSNAGEHLTWSRKRTSEGLARICVHGGHVRSFVTLVTYW